MIKLDKFWSILRAPFEFMKDSWPYIEPVIQIFALALLIRLYYSLQNQLVGTWDGNLRNSDNYDVVVTISFYIRNGDLHALIFYRGIGHDGRQVRGVDRTVRHEPSLSEQRLVGSSQTTKWWPGFQILIRSFARREFEIKCEGKMRAEVGIKFNPVHIGRTYSYTFSRDDFRSNRLKCKVDFVDENGTPIALSGQFSKVR